MLISLCASPDAKVSTSLRLDYISPGNVLSQVRPIALKYLLDNMSGRYSDYNPSHFYEIPYLPAVKDGKAVMGSPKDVNVSSPF